MSKKDIRKGGAAAQGGVGRPAPSARETSLAPGSGFLSTALTLGAIGLGAWLAWRTTRSLREIDLKDHNVLITGGSRGLGLVLGRELAQQGANLIICARDPDELKRAFDDLSGRGARVLALRCDVTD